MCGLSTCSASGHLRHGQCPGAEGQTREDGLRLDTSGCVLGIWGFEGFGDLGVQGLPRGRCLQRPGARGSKLKAFIGSWRLNLLTFQGIARQPATHDNRQHRLILIAYLRCGSGVASGRHVHQHVHGLRPIQLQQATKPTSKSNQSNTLNPEIRTQPQSLNPDNLIQKLAPKRLRLLGLQLQSQSVRGAPKAYSLNHVCMDMLRT